MFSQIQNNHSALVAFNSFISLLSRDVRGIWFARMLMSIEPLANVPP